MDDRGEYKHTELGESEAVAARIANRDPDLAKPNSREQGATPMTENAHLQSGVLSSPADAMLSRAIAETLGAPASERARLFERLVREIESYMRAHPDERP